MLLREHVREDVAGAAPGRRARRLAWAMVGLALAAAGWFVTSALRDGREDATPAAGGKRVATATAERRTLVERESVDGKLGYAGTRSVVHRMAGGGSGSAQGSGSAEGSDSAASGTVTWLAPSGSVIQPGGVLFRVDDRPVVLMDGAVPAYRRLASGVSRGPDVLQLERNLVALGFGAGVTVDERFTSATDTAVRRWQRSLGQRRSGAVELGRVVFLPGARRVGERKAAVGTAVSDGTEILVTSATRRVVSVELEASKQSLVHRGDRVRVTLPDGTEVAGRVASVGRAARSQQTGEDEGGNGGGEEPVVDVAIALRSSRGTRGLDQAPVTVDIARRVERDALAVPVTALLARPGGGYAVEVVGRDGRRRLTAVETGFFADGYVEVGGRGLRSGTRVVVPS